MTAPTLTHRERWEQQVGWLIELQECSTLYRLQYYFLTTLLPLVALRLLCAFYGTLYALKWALFGPLHESGIWDVIIQPSRIAWLRLHDDALMFVFRRARDDAERGRVERLQWTRWEYVWLAAGYLLILYIVSWRGYQAFNLCVESIKYMSA